MSTFIKNSLLTAIVSLGLVGPLAAFAAGPATVNLGSAGNYVILAKTAITTTGVTSIVGDIAISPALSTDTAGFSLVLDGSGTFSTSALVTGRVYAANYTAPTPATLTAAVSAMEAAYTDAATRTPGVGATNLNLGGGTLNGHNLVPGTYTWGSNVTITGDITFTGAAADTWILQISGNLDIQTGKKIILAGGAQAKNIFWQVAGTTTLLPSSTFYGIILAGPGASTIAMQSGAVLHGRALGQTDVTLVANTISMPATTAAIPTSGRRFPVIVPIIDLIKVPTPLALPAGPGIVTYNYTVKNIGGQQELLDITLVDDKCSPSYASGDLNGDSKLDIDEVWKYTCTSLLSADTTNTAIATGHSSDGYYSTAVDTAIATVVVGKQVQPPLINVVKVPNQLTPYSFGGGDVTYTYTVTNPGVVAMSNVLVTDDKCQSVLFSSGDSNNNNLLDTTESWMYTCKTRVQVSTGSVATAKGSANGFTAVAYAFTNVLVAAPELPDTGLTPDGISWTSALLSGVILVLATLLFKVSRKNTL